MIFTYKKDAVWGDGQRKLCTPPWVERGGAYPRKSNKTWLGFSPTTRDWKMPTETLVIFTTLADLKTHFQVIHTEEVFKKMVDEVLTDLTTTEVDALATTYWDNNQG